MEQEFDFNDMTDEEIEEYLGDVIGTPYDFSEEDDKEELHIINPERCREFLIAHRAIKEALGDSGVKIAIDTGEGVSDSWAIIVSFKNPIEFTDTDMLSYVGRVSSAFDICPMLDGTTEMTFTFYGMTIKMELPEEE